MSSAVAKLLKNLFSFGKNLKQLDNLTKLGQTTGKHWTGAVQLFRSSADNVVDVFGRRVSTKLIRNVDGTARLRVLGRNGNELLHSATNVAAHLHTGNLARAAKMLDSTLQVPKRLVAQFDKLAKTTPVGAFSTKIKNIAKINEELSSLPTAFSRKVSSESEFLAKVATSKQSGRLKALTDALRKTPKKNIGGLIKITGVSVVGVAVYKILTDYARNASGCYRTTKVAGNLLDCRVAEYSVVKLVKDAKNCLEPHPPKPDVDSKEIVGDCLACCDDEKLELGAYVGVVHYECVSMDIWDALGDITSNLAIGIGERIKSLGIWKYLGIGVAAFVIIAIGGRFAYKWYQRRLLKRQYQELINEADDEASITEPPRRKRKYE